MKIVVKEQTCAHGIPVSEYCADCAAEEDVTYPLVGDPAEEDEDE